MFKLAKMDTTTNQMLSCKDVSPLAHSTPSSSDTHSSFTDTISLSSSDSDLRDQGIPTGRSRSSREDIDSSAGNVSVAAKQVIEIVTNQSMWFQTHP